MKIYLIILLCFFVTISSTFSTNSNEDHLISPNTFVLFKTKEKAKLYKQKYKLKGKIRVQPDGTYAIENRRDHSAIFENLQSGEIVSAVLCVAPRDGFNDSESLMYSAERKEPYSGFLGFVEYVLTDGEENGLQYNRDGYPIRIAPITGMPLAGASKIKNGIQAVKALRSNGWIKRKIFRSLSPDIKRKVAFAIKNGIVGPTGRQGIVKLTTSEITTKGLVGYTHKIKILGKGGDIRIFGKQQANGHIIFDKIGRH